MNNAVVIVRARRHFVVGTLFAAFFFVWLIGGTVTLLEAWTDPRVPPTGKAFVAVWSLCWALGAYATGFAALWMTGGCERLTLRSNELLVEVGLWTRYFASPSVFALSDVHNMRIERVERRGKGHMFVSHRLAFDYRGKVVLLRSDIPEQARPGLRLGPLADLFETTR